MTGKPCRRFAPLISAYIDDELNEKKVPELEQHLNDCPHCHGNFENEKEVKELVQQRIRVQEAPSYLQNRIRRLLTRSGRRPGFWEIIQSLFVYRPAAASFALVLLGILIIFPVYQIVDSGMPVGSQSISSEGDITGEILCLDCELNVHEYDQIHAPGTYRAGLRADDGRVWTFMRSSEQKELLDDSRLLQRRASVSGIVFENAQYILVENYKVL